MARPARRHGLRRLADPGIATGSIALRDAARRLAHRLVLLRDLAAPFGMGADAAIDAPSAAPNAAGDPRLVAAGRLWPGCGRLRQAVAVARPAERLVIGLLGVLALGALAVATGGLLLNAAGVLLSQASAQAIPALPPGAAPAAFAMPELFGPELFGDDSATRRFLAVLYGIARGEGAVAGMFAIFNLAMLFIAGLLVMILFTQAVLDTARGGRPGLSGVQVLRVVVVLALVAPLGGFSAVQHGVLAAAGLGGAAASRLWAAFSTAVIADGAAALPVAAVTGHERLIGQFLVAETCRATANAVAEIRGSPAYVTLVTRRPGPSGSDRMTIAYDAAEAPGACGVVRFAAPVGSGAAAGIAEAHRRALFAVLPEIRAVAAQLAGRYVDGMADYGRPLPAPAIDALAQRYAATAGTAILAAREAASRDMAAAIAYEAVAGGWLAAPLVFQTIARRNGAVQAAARSLPLVDPPVTAYATHVPEAITAAEAVRVWIAADGRVAGRPDMADLGEGAVFERLIVLLDLRIDLVDDTAPLTSLAAIGNTLVDAGLKGFAILGGIMTGSNLFRAIPFVGGGLDAAGALWQVIDVPVTTMLMALFAAGAVLAWLVPLIPFIRFAFALGAWLLGLLEALLGAPIWLLAFLSTDRDRLVPAAAREGAGLLLATVLRPLLMIFALVLGYLAASLLCGFLNSGFAPLLGAVDADGIGPIDWLVHVVIYTLLAYLAVNLAFGAMDRMPAGVLQWIGIRIDGGLAGEAAGRSIAAGLGRAERMRPGLPGGER